MGPAAHFVHYFVQQQRLVNFVAIFDQDAWTRESWTDRGEVADALAAFEGWHPQVHAIIGAVDETFIWALFDRPPLPRWSKGRVTLLGDACHPMLPFMAQGAAQGLEDGADAHRLPDRLTRTSRGRWNATSSRRLPRDLEDPGDVEREQAPLPPARRARPAGARRAHGERLDRLHAKAVEWIYAHDARAI